MTTPDTRPSCGHGNHTWLLRRRYTGTEFRRVTSITDGERALTHIEVNPGDATPLFVDVGDVDSDEYNDVVEETLSCSECPATIDASRLEQIQ
jgi:hypothetical protein